MEKKEQGCIALAISKLGNGHLPLAQPSLPQGK